MRINFEHSTNQKNALTMSCSALALHSCGKELSRGKAILYGLNAEKFKLDTMC